MKAEDDIQKYEMALWHVLHVRPRCEKKLAKYCDSVNLEHYLPLRTERKVYQRRKVDVLKPLFPGYVFAKFNAFQRILVLKSQQIVHILQVKDQVGLINELNQIRQALEVDPCLNACPAVEQGTLVRIISGPFQGMEGMVATLKDQTRVVLNVDIIGKGVPLVTDLDILERL